MSEIEVKIAQTETTAAGDIKEILKMRGKKDDQQKINLSLLPMDALIEVAKVMDFGARKYDPHNWRSGFDWTRLSSAMLRHIFAWIGGETNDPESGLNHIAHAACGCLFLLEHQSKGYGEDDRYKEKE